MRYRGALVGALALVGVGALAGASQSPGAAAPEVSALEPELEALYKDLHQHPELAFHERRTAEALASRVKALGFEVTLEATLRSMVRAEVVMLTELLAAPPSGA